MSNVNIEVACRFIANDNGEHSFQLYNKHTNHVLFGCPRWFKTREEAETIANTFQKEVAESLGAGGNLNVARIDDNSFTLGIDPSKVDTNKTLKTVCAMAVHRDNGKYGYAICDEDSKEVLIRPKEWFRTAKLAFDSAVNNVKKTIDDLQAIAISRGIGVVRYSEPQLADFEIDPETTPPVATIGMPMPKLTRNKNKDTDLFSVDQLCHMFKFDTKPEDPETSPNEPDDPTNN